ncbi:MAG: substrate-binding domain-containing protein [Deltaproteobacteria bacterium]|nr:substrate-binding domain-containing protein [Deltaproteobacteria bacterium]
MKRLSLKFMISTLMAMMLMIPDMAIAGDIVIIGNQSVAESKLSKQDVKNIYLGRKTFWSGKKKIVFVTLGNADLSVKFLAEYINMIPSRYADYWLNKVYTGQGSPPRSFASDKEMIDFVARTEGAIGYVSSGKGLDNVKIFAVE